MGGDAWRHTGPYQPDLAAAFRQAQEEELVKDNHGFDGRSVEELGATQRGTSTSSPVGRARRWTSPS